MKTKQYSCFLTLQRELKSLRSLDNKNQLSFTSGKSPKNITKEQLILLTEAIFFASFRAHEQFIRNLFLIYCCGKQKKGRKRVISYLSPKSIKHAEQQIKSSLQYIDWSNPEILINRADAYLKGNTSAI